MNLRLPPSFQRSVGYTLSSYGSMFFGNRLVRTRMLGGVGAGGERPPATRLGRLLLPMYPAVHLLIYLRAKRTCFSVITTNVFDSRSGYVLRRRDSTWIFD